MMLFQRREVKNWKSLQTNKHHENEQKEENKENGNFGIIYKTRHALTASGIFTMKGFFVIGKFLSSLKALR